MKKTIVAGLVLSVLSLAFAINPEKSFGGVNVNVGVSVPLPPVIFSAPPPVFVIPGTYVYAVPDIAVDVFFYRDYWYRPYEGRWYRAKSYKGPWIYIVPKGVPGPVLRVPPGFRHGYKEHKHIPYGHLKKNWRKWEREKYHDKRWDKKR